MWERLRGLLRNGTVTQEKWGRGVDRKQGKSHAEEPTLEEAVSAFSQVTACQGGGRSEFSGHALFLSPPSCPPVVPQRTQEPMVAACINHALYFLYIYIFFLIYLFIYLFMAVLGLRFCARAFSICGERGPLFIAVRGPLTIAASLVAEHRLQTRRLSSCDSRA